MRFYGADLHIHTALSCCASEEMSPNAICRRALDMGLSVIAVTDHNSCENVEAMVEAGRRHGITVIAGMEVESREEVHVLAWFPGVEQALCWQDRVYRSMPVVCHDWRKFGTQVTFDIQGQRKDVVDRLLSMSSGLTLAQIAEGVRKLGGLCCAAHIDRPRNSLLGQLGLVPVEMEFDCFELVHAQSAGEMRGLQALGVRGPFVLSSDAHRLAEIRPVRMAFYMSEPTLEEIRLALKGVDNRGVVFL
ncbi:MAG: PHP domain-containing protein [Bacillota bacterium]